MALAAGNADAAGNAPDIDIDFVSASEEGEEESEEEQDQVGDLPEAEEKSQRNAKDDYSMADADIQNVPFSDNMS